MAQEKAARRDRGDIIAELIGVSDSLFILSQLFTEEDRNLGHATAAFTLDVYGHVSERMKENSAARMQAYIEKMA